MWQEAIDVVDGERKLDKEAGNMAKQGNGWECSSEGWVKLNLDAGVKDGWGMGFGLVYRDDRGRYWCVGRRSCVTR